MILANFSSVPANSLQTALVIFAAIVVLVGGLAGITLTVITIIEKIRAKRSGEVAIAGQPVRMKTDEPLATKPDLAAVEKRLESDITELRQQFASERSAARTSLGKVHKRIDDVLQVAAKTDGRLDNVEELLGKVLDQLLKKS